MIKSISNSQWAASAFIVGAVGLGLVPLIWFAASQGGLRYINFDQTILSVLLFTLKQALLSTLISIALGLLVARALARREFLGKDLLLAVFAVPFALPAIVAVLGVATLYGAQGWLGGWINIYGLSGILGVHVFFNLPLAARIFYEALTGIAQENFKLATQLSFSDRYVFRYLEWPALRSALPGVACLIFLLCAASFVVVLTLGGPNATTLEVAIYQSLRMDFDVGRALALSILQVVLCFILVRVAGQLVLQHHGQGEAKQTTNRFDGRTLMSRSVDVLAIVVAVFIVLPPLIIVAIEGLPHVSINSAILFAAFFSLGIGFGAALLALVLAWPLGKMPQLAAQNLALAGLIVPPAVMATGWFLALKKFDTGIGVTLLSVIILNAMMALPFSVAILRARFVNAGAPYEKLCRQLGLAGWKRFWRIDLPFMAPALRQAGLISFVVSLGDLTAVTLLGSNGLTTLPQLIHQQMGNYRSNAAAGTALVLALCCFGLAMLAQRSGKAQ